MAYPDKVLADDEDVVLDLRKHWKTVAGPILVLLLVAGVTSFGLAAAPVGPYQDAVRLAIAAAAALLLVVYVLVPFLRWRTTRYVITTHRVLIRTGILARNGRDVPLARVNDVHFEHSFVERLLRCGSLVVESAGERGQVLLGDVPRVESVQRELYRLVESDDNRRRLGRHDLDGDGVI